MEIRPLAISGAYEITPKQFWDPRGSFREWYRADALEEAIGRSIDLRQANISRSAKGVFRGIHYVDLPGQAKYETCASGAVIFGHPSTTSINPTATRKATKAIGWAIVS